MIHIGAVSPSPPVASLSPLTAAAAAAATLRPPRPPPPRSRSDAPPQSLPVLLLGAAAHEAMIW